MHFSAGEGRREERNDSLYSAEQGLRITLSLPGDKSKRIPSTSLKTGKEGEEGKIYYLQREGGRNLYFRNREGIDTEPYLTFSEKRKRGKRGDLLILSTPGENQNWSLSTDEKKHF